jgi:hypothetical protein
MPAPQALADVFTGAGYALWPIRSTAMKSSRYFPKMSRSGLHGSWWRLLSLAGRDLPVCLFVEYGGGGHRGASQKR